MREIIFRGKSKDNGEWVEGYFNRYSIGNRYLIAQNGEYDEDRPYMDFSVEADFFEIIPETIGQFTGLNDKNKAKIFEGDIVRCYDRNLDDEFTAVVEFGNPNGAYNWGFQLRPITKTNFNTDILLWVEMEETGVFIEVIGNIQDSPEVLKGEENAEIKPC